MRETMRAPTVVVENGSYFMDNLGDVSMLQVCVGRIRDRWPDARIRVVVETPDRLLAAIPGVEPLAPAHGHRIPMTTRTRHPAILAVERRLDRHAPRLARWARRRQIAHDAERSSRYDAFHAALDGAGAVISSGGGFITDRHPGQTARVVHTLGTAQALGRPTAMLSAGLGPLHDEDLRRVAAPVIGSLDVLGLREEEGNRAELRAWGCAPPRVFVTGDDAVELAHPAPPGAGSDDGGAVGVSLRFAGEYGLAEAPGLGETVRAFCRRHDAPLLGLPVRTRLSPDDDIDALRALLGGSAPDLEETAAIDTPEALIRRVRRCRVVLTGTYHAGVFALAVGTPVVTLSSSDYYDRKFAGLAEQFGASAVRSLRYETADLASAVRGALEEAWAAPPELRAGLREAAADQQARSREAYDAFFRLVENRGAHREGRSRAS